MKIADKFVKTVTARVIFFCLLAFSSIAMFGQLSNGKDTSAGISDETKLQITTSYGKLPLSFEANHGQIDEQVKFFSRGSGYSLFLTATEAVLALSKTVEPEVKKLGIDDATTDRTNPNLSTTKKQPLTNNTRSSVLHMKLVGSNKAPTITGVDQLPGRINYFKGNDKKKWRANVPGYKKVKYNNVYPDIDMVYYGNQRQLEYDFVVKPGAAPDIIKLNFDGADKLEIADNGDLVVHIGGSKVVQHAPIIYQEVNGHQKKIDGCYVLNSNSKLKNSQSELVGFQVAAYDTGKPLTIDPVLIYSTYLGGSVSDFGNGITVDTSGNAYVTGEARSEDFPTTANAIQQSLASNDVFVTKLNLDGTAIVYSTYLGGSVSDFGEGITVDTSGNAYVTGSTTSPDFPTTENAIEQSKTSGDNDAFVTKLNPDGTALVYSTYLGGGGFDGANDIAVDTSGNAYITGGTTSSDFPTTANAIQQSKAGSSGDAFVTKLNPDGTALVYSTYLGGAEIDFGAGIAVDISGNAYVTGKASSGFPTTANAIQQSLAGSGNFDDVFVTKLNLDGTALVYSTYLGGSFSDSGADIAVDTSGNAYVTGKTESTDFPTTENAIQQSKANSNDAFVTKLNPDGTALVYSSLLGGDDSDFGEGIAVDTSGNAYVTGFTRSTDFPTTENAIQQSLPGFVNAFVTKLNPDGTALVYSTYLGGSVSGSGAGIAVDISGNAYVTGATDSTNFPTTANAIQQSLAGSDDAFVVKISDADAPISVESPTPTPPVSTPNPDTTSTPTPTATSFTTPEPTLTPVPVSTATPLPGVNVTPAPEATPAPSSGFVSICNAKNENDLAEEFAHIDIVSVETEIIEGETLKATFTLKDVPETLTVDRIDMPKNFLEYSWAVNIDVDNNLQTGSQFEQDQSSFGADFSIGTRHFNPPFDVVTGETTFENNTTEMSISDMQTDVSIFDNDGSSQLFGEADIEVDSQSNTITLIGGIPGISSESKINFITTDFNPPQKDDFSNFRADFSSCIVDLNTEPEPTPTTASTVDLSVDAKASFIHTVDDSPEPPLIVDLKSINLEPGDTIEISYNSSDQGFSSFGCEGPFVEEADEIELLGVFSESDTLLSERLLNRVADAIDTGDDVETGPTFNLDEPTDIPEDFKITPANSFTIEIPDDASHLFFGFADSFFGDNCGAIDIIINTGTTDDDAQPTPTPLRDKPTADFFSNLTSGIVPFTVEFTDASTGNASEWLWAFGDGGSSSDQNPEHTYGNAGLFSVILTVTGSGGSDTIIKSDLISVTGAPVANFETNITAGFTPLGVAFNDLSTGSISNWSWDFGDGNSSAEQNPFHEYQVDGFFTVTLTISGPGGADLIEKTDLIRALPISAPVAAFSANATVGLTPFEVQFSDLSSGDVSSWSWDFGDGATSSEQSPLHEYKTEGSFTVTLIINGAGGTDTETKTNFINTIPTEQPRVEFSVSPTAAFEPLNVQFTDLSQGVDLASWLWDFGDGGISSARSPVHEYNVEGIYSPSLNVSGKGGIGFKKKTNLVIAIGKGKPIAEFNASPTVFFLPETVTFTDLSEGDEIASWTWNFGDGGISSEQKPTHAYNVEGYFTVTLTVSNKNGISRETKTNLINPVSVGNPLAEFSASPTTGNLPLDVTFNELAEGDIDNFFWDLGDGATSKKKAPSHTYNRQGFFTVSLTVSGSNGANTRVKENLINTTQDETDDGNNDDDVSDEVSSVNADFTATPTSGRRGMLKVQFTDTSTGDITSWLWDFGDGKTSVEQNPLHKYKRKGKYSVNLTVSGPEGTAVETKSDFITLGKDKRR